MSVGMGGDASPGGFRVKKEQGYDGDVAMGSAADSPGDDNDGHAHGRHDEAFPEIEFDAMEGEY